MLPVGFGAIGCCYSTRPGDLPGVDGTMDAVTAGTRTQISPYAVFDRGSWRALAAGSTLPLDEAGLRALASLGDRIDLDEVATVYLPLARLLDLHVTASHLTTEAMWRARDWTELDRTDEVVVHLDLAQRGLGTGSCT